MFQFPSVVLVSGNDEYLRRRYLQQVIDKHVSEGFTLSWFDTGEVEELRNLIVSGGFLFVEPTLAVVQGVDDAMTEVICSHHDDPNEEVRIIVDLGSKAGRLGKRLTAKIGVRYHQKFRAAPKWKADEVATGFVQDEAKRWQKFLPKNLARGLVEKAGSDRGLLSYEIRKVVALADTVGSEVIEASQLVVVHRMVEGSVLSVVEALSCKDTQSLLTSCREVRETHPMDPTMRVCRVLISSVFNWIKVAYCRDLGLDDKAAAERLQISLFLYKEKFLQASRCWGLSGLIDLLEMLAETERSVLRGCPNPWVGLVSRLVSSCDE